ncbi:glycosyltransferase family 4 protein [Micromonospora sp. MH99]|uniref:glycosyltransferase family 4 protein n=1 Tax=Micromonospora sp. MH99 TaxID=1945510 RepID=UPI001F30953F|nr:glycosyltransferase [Micromonospora sp. MH99]MCF0095786.1 GDP-mannose-dependent alpha-(1-6)-phosphatidylinositol monomannoside mannosyltransferase [Micromonospora sp. MH99]
MLDRSPEHTPAHGLVHLGEPCTPQEKTDVKALVAVEARFARTPDGAIWTREGPAYGFFTRYLSAFDEVLVLARVADVASVAPNSHRVDGHRVTVRPVPHYLGPWQYLRRRRAVVRALRAADDPHAVLILRAPTVLGSLLATTRDRSGLPYAVEVMADPFTVYAPGVVNHPLRPLLRRRYTNMLRRQCRAATGVSYVTERYLQLRYPPGAHAVTAAYSSVEMPPDAYVAAPPLPRHRDEYVIVSVGSLEMLYKGIDTLIRALSQLLSAGLPVRCVHIGTGRQQAYLERLATQLGVRDKIEFLGSVPAGEQVRQHVDAADVFAMPSRTEGLPKALVEAMARGLPAIGSSVGGIPELLAEEDIVPPDDPAALADAIGRLLNDPARRAQASARNLARARDFSQATLERRRNDFYRAVREAAAQQDCETERILHQRSRRDGSASTALEGEAVR